jgi:7-keto-8-aminopelargonate synthetase-like enzyme
MAPESWKGEVKAALQRYLLLGNGSVNMSLQQPIHTTIEELLEAVFSIESD